VMTILLSLMQSEKQVRLERLSRVFPCSGGDNEAKVLAL
jgi:hypothetical protein